MLPKLRYLAIASVAGTLLLPALAVAQAPPQQRAHLVPKKEQSGPKDCVHTRTTSKADPQVPEGQNLSRQLAQANGVICPPPQVDPKMTKKPAPGGGTMPVIRPPGSDQNHTGTEPK
jgi:hypothetical protein